MNEANLTARTWSCAVFDLDGTIADSVDGVVGSLRVAFAAADIAAPPDDVMRSWVGPPMIESLRRSAGLDERDAQRVLRHYRAHYDTIGVLDSPFFPRIPELLSTLADSRLPMAIATSKPEAPTRLLAERLDIVKYFAVISGASTSDGRTDKLTILAHALDGLAKLGFDTSRPVMVGDRHHDIDAAVSLGISAIFVTWGYGEASEGRGAAATASSPDELEALLVDRAR
jgi:phosphoglycolate phosphatase